MLPKRSTSVDQNLGSKSIHFRFPVTISIAPKAIGSFEKFPKRVYLVAGWRDIYTDQ